MRPARRGTSLSYKGKTLLSNVDPIAFADKVAGNVSITSRTLYICPSPLLGYGLDTLLDRIGQDSAVLCIETDSVLFNLARETIPSATLADGRVGFVLAGSTAEICSYVRRRFGPRSFRKTTPVRLNGGYSLSPDFYENAASALSDLISLEWRNAMTLVKLGRRYALNAVRNLGLLPSTFPASALRYGDAPVLVLGAGPSLDSIEALLRKRERFRIVCVDTALIPLAERGVRPDLIVALEAQHWNLRDFVGVSRLGCDLAMDLTALPCGAHALGGRRFLFSVAWTPLRFLERLEDAELRPPPSPPLGSVGLTAVDIALSLGTGPVFVAGLDFAYGIGTYHARSAPSRLTSLSATNRLLPLIDPAPAFRSGSTKEPDKSGRTVFSDPALRGYRSLFEREFNAQRRLFDIGDSGLDLGLPRVSPDDAESAFSERAFTEPPAEIGPTIADPTKVIAFIQAELRKLEAVRAHLKGLRSNEDIESLLSECDYLWSHFPECAGTEGQRPPASDTAFVKRVRAEVDVFMKAFALAAAEAAR